MGDAVAVADQDAVALGYNAQATDPQGVAVGSGAEVWAGVALGYNTTTQGGVVAGWGATSPVNGVAIGYGAQAPDSATAIGFLANAGLGDGTALGYGTTVAAGHNKAIALGYGAATSSGFQLKLGDSGGVHIETAALGWDAGAPAAGYARLWFQVIGGKMKLCARFPTGATQIVATEP